MFSLKLILGSLVAELYSLQRILWLNSQVNHYSNLRTSVVNEGKHMCLRIMLQDLN